MFKWLTFSVKVIEALGYSTGVLTSVFRLQAKVQNGGSCLACNNHVLEARKEKIV